MLSNKEVLRNRKRLSEVDKHVAATFKALGDVTRYRIFRILTEHHKISVSTLAKILDISIPLMSRHIKILEHTHLVHKERDGKRIYCKLKHTGSFAQSVIKTIGIYKKIK
ncbi:MAG: Uncharacterized protein G01um101413_635 [Parcubacteria group bacterium Gr01-1014_13]|nr:MAG: Uncharacterized protein G01um101413_635 [Parcubacteria group bacterium Gr01-1014_13]